TAGEEEREGDDGIVGAVHGRVGLA
ncbi:MAG: hypothetical protein JWM10_1320, partial [Myxococcaceae bacterium]|nr:hypothetical protein [Myxococcaceae bacterium]